MSLLTDIAIFSLVAIETISLIASVVIRRSEKAGEAKEISVISELRQAIQVESTKSRDLVRQSQMHIADEVSKALEPFMDPPVQVGASRIYAAILAHGDMHRLYLAAAKDTTEFINVGKSAVGPQWVAEVIESIDVFPPNKEIVPVPVAPTKAEKKRLSLDEFVHHLEYARDAFTDTSYQKEAIDRIITSVKEKYV